MADVMIAWGAMTFEDSEVMPLGEEWVVKGFEIKMSF